MASTCIKFALSVPTAAVMVGSYMFNVPHDISMELPDAAMDLSEFPSNYEQGYQIKDLSSLQTQYSLMNDEAELYLHIETIHKFASNVLENIVDLDPEYSRVIDDNFWDLV